MKKTLLLILPLLILTSCLKEIEWSISDTVKCDSYALTNRDDGHLNDFYCKDWSYWDRICQAVEYSWEKCVKKETYIKCWNNRIGKDNNCFYSCKDTETYDFKTNQCVEIKCPENSKLDKEYYRCTCLEWFILENKQCISESKKKINTAFDQFYADPNISEDIKQKVSWLVDSWKLTANNALGILYWVGYDPKNYIQNNDNNWIDSLDKFADSLISVRDIGLYGYSRR